MSKSLFNSLSNERTGKMLKLVRLPHLYCWIRNVGINLQIDANLSFFGRGEWFSCSSWIEFVCLWTRVICTALSYLQFIKWVKDKERPRVPIESDNSEDVSDSTLSLIEDTQWFLVQFSILHNFPPYLTPIPLGSPMNRTGTISLLWWKKWEGQQLLPVCLNYSPKIPKSFPPTALEAACRAETLYDPSSYCS